MAETPLKDWNSDLLDCFEDVKTCCYGFWCCPCLACTVSGRFKENYCLPLCDILSPAVFAACGIPLFIPPAALALRASVRNKHGIKGSICKDIIASCFCVCCVWCQMHRELKAKDRAPVVITTQPQTIVHVQANPVMMVNQNPAPPPRSCGGQYAYPNPAPSNIPGGQYFDPNPPPYPGGYKGN